MRAHTGPGRSNGHITNRDYMDGSFSMAKPPGTSWLYTDSESHKGTASVQMTLIPFYQKSAEISYTGSPKHIYYFPPIKKETCDFPATKPPFKSSINFTGKCFLERHCKDNFSLLA
jgi:hypothetical protein